ncbi:flagellar hook-length control protein FliK, partial [Planktotalea sp.]|uniref:flagellar hook-length control protein FliK n=1 Tax=Planktotalea sp. TaxID=2029877 RepID=UPI00329A17CB
MNVLPVASPKNSEVPEARSLSASVEVISHDFKTRQRSFSEELEGLSTFHDAANPQELEDEILLRERETQADNGVETKEPTTSSPTTETDFDQRPALEDVNAKPNFQSVGTDLRDAELHQTFDQQMAKTVATVQISPLQAQMLEATSNRSTPTDAKSNSIPQTPLLGFASPQAFFPNAMEKKVATPPQGVAIVQSDVVSLNTDRSSETALGLPIDPKQTATETTFSTDGVSNTAAVETEDQRVIRQRPETNQIAEKLNIYGSALLSDESTQTNDKLLETQTLSTKNIENASAQVERPIPSPETNTPIPPLDVTSIFKGSKGIATAQSQNQDIGSLELSMRAMPDIQSAHQPQTSMQFLSSNGVNSAPKTSPAANLQAINNALLTLQDDGSQINVSLSPEELGKLTIKLDQTAQGTIFTFSAERAETQELIRRQLEQLQEQ